MKRITKVFLIACVCAVSMSCSKDDDEKGDGYVCYECTITSKWSDVTETQPICGEKNWAELTIKSIKDNLGSDYTVRCVRKK